MPRHVEIYLNGTSLRSVAQTRTWIQQVTEEVPAPDMVTAAFPGWDGERLVRGERRGLKVTVTVTIHEVFNLAARAAALEAIAKWVGSGGVLTASYRTGQRLRVVPSGRPALGAVRDYTQEVKIEFTAYAVPYWEDATATAVTGTAGATGSLSITVPGSHETPLDAEITAGAAVTSLALTVNGRTISLTGLSLSSGDKVTFEHTDEDILLIKAGSTHILSKRTADSADDLLLIPGANTVSWTADGSVTVKAMARGRYE